MKNDEIQKLSLEELNEKIKGEKETLQKMKFAHAISPIENPMKIREAKKLVARLKTELTKKERAK
jgi:large subunit ribosomal protein L29